MTTPGTRPAWTVNNATDFLLANLGVDALSKARANDVMNDALVWIENAGDWACLRSGQVVLDLVEGQPFVELPPDLKSITGYSATKALVNTFTFTTLHELIKLRANQTISSQLHYWAALEWVPAAGTNLGLETETFSGSSWINPGVLTITEDNGQSPISEEMSADLLVSANDTQFLHQDINYALLSSGDYVASIWIREEGTNAFPSQLALSAVNGSASVACDIDWTGTLPVVTVVGPATDTQVTVTPGPNGYVRVGIAMTYDKTDGDGALRYSIYPTAPGSGANAASVEVFGFQLERTLKSRYSFMASITSLAPTEYEQVLTTKRLIGAPRRLAASLWPTPTDSDPENGNITITYERQFTRVGNDCEFIDLPDYLLPSFKEVMLHIGRGWEESDHGFPSERLEMFKHSAMFNDAMDRDGAVEPNYGPMNATHVYPNQGGWINWDSGRTATIT